MAQWSELMRSPLRDVRLGGSIVFGSGESCPLDGERVFSLSIDEGADGCLAPGSVLSASCRLDLVNNAGQWNPGGSLRGQNELIGATLLPRLGVLDGDAILWRDLGAFQVESAVQLEGEGVLRLQAQDSIAFELSAPYRDDLSYPQSLNGVWTHALAQTRYIWQGTLPGGSGVISLQPDFKGASLRAVLGYVVALAGCFVQADRSGSLQLKPVWNAGSEAFAIDGENYLQLEGDELSYGPVDALKLNCADGGDEKIYINGAGLHALKVAGNPLLMQADPGLDDLAEGMLGRVSGFETGALRLSWRGDPGLCIGDRIQITDLQGRVHRGVVSRQSLVFDRGFSATCACDVPDAAATGVQRAITPEGGLNAAALTGAVDGGLLRVGSVTTEKLAAGCVTAEKLSAGAIDTVALEAVTAKIESLTAGDISTDRLAAALAAFTVVTAGTASFDRATVAHLVAQALNLSFGTAGDVFIENLKVAYAQMVSAAIGNLCIKASDGNYYAIDVSADGSVTATRASLSVEEIAAGQTDAGRVILETSLTAQSLNTANLLATYALVNRIDAARIDVDTLWAREAFISHLHTADISSNGSIVLIAGKADDALSAASAAQSAAETAGSDAAGARTAADAAQSAASSAQSAAGTAQSAANAAQSAASAARSTAEDARSAANLAETAAGNAQSTADAAQNAANTAQSTADSAASDAADARDAADAAQSLADAALPRTDFQRVVRIDESGLHVGDNLTTSEVLIDSQSVNVVMGGRKYSRFASNYVQFGNYQLRQSADGGLVFKLKEI